MVLGTGQIAKLCRCSPRTAAKWIDSGVLSGWTIPNSRVRRVALTTLITFLQSHGMPALTHDDIASIKRTREGGNDAALAG